MANLGIKGVQSWLENNPANGKKAQFYLKEGPPAIIVGNIPVESLRLPPGYYPNPQGMITNRKNVPEGEPFDRIPYECDVQFFVNQAKERAAQERRAKNPLFKEIFPKTKKEKK